ncbi:hypothetical protein DMN91_011314 [Ooceraea biroi]|uniref:Fatty acid synthase n=1 Tax=Ooceraea biroi TaxID=2015173 RepID=A0A3L8D9R2_OOCBI|nr:fatty acid synthase [Ooceraea biroi]RLU17245.1 hypothetical protein DMN91_011314 [Ooceraea biroi]
MEDGIPCLDDIVIAGISGRFPESSNMEEFKENLMKQMDMVNDDERRWPASMCGLPHRSGKIKDLSTFDASFFGVHPRQAHVMDPQLRLLLEATYEAIVDAGVNPSTIRGSRTGVFVGASASESDDFWSKDLDSVNGYGLLGCCRAMFSNRISFAFNFVGPSCTFDSACSSSLSALHYAIATMRAGECDSAIVGSVHLLLKPANTLHFQKLNLLSQDGKCKAFDAAADGYVRSEAVVAVYLQKAKDARRIYGTVIGTKINNDGYKPQGITYPSGKMQNQMLREVYSEAKIDPADVVYVEAHGTGTELGDFEEVNSIDKMFCENRKTPLLIGSVKSNMGHAEPASGLCSIAKVLIAMETGVIPGNLHFAIPNLNIPAFEEGRIRVIDKATPWNGGFVGISSFGFGGANGHVILHSNPRPKLPPTLNTGLPSKLVLVSGRTEEAVHTLLEKAKEHRGDDEFLSLLRVVHKDKILEHRVRGYGVFDGDGSTREIIATTKNDEQRPIWFLFSGMGAQWPGMGKQLLGIQVFQRSLRRCADALLPYGVDLMNIILNGTDETYKNVTNTFVSTVAIQIALVDVLTSIGIQPDGIVGHSVGELTCAYADGTVTLEQTVLMAYFRGDAVVSSKLEPGAMAAVGLSWEEAKKICPPDIIPACNNSADLVTVSGPVESLRAFMEQLKSKNIFAKLVDSCGLAFHSKYIAASESKMRASLDRIVPSFKRRSAKWISSSVPEAAWNAPIAQFSSPAYFVNNLLSPVLFREAMTHVPENAVTIEIAPHGLLQAVLRRSLPGTVAKISLQKRDHVNNLAFLLSNIGKLYTVGAQPDILKLYPPVNFPVARGTPMIGSLVKWDHSITWKVPTYHEITSGRAGDYVVTVDLSSETDAYLAGHRLEGRVFFPGVGYLVFIWKIFARMHGAHFERLPVVFENVHFQRATIVPKDGAITFLINIFRETGHFQICESNSVVVTGNVRASKNIRKEQLDLPALSPPSDKENLPMNARDVYKTLNLQGYEYGGIFQGIKSCDSYGATGALHWFNEWIPYIDSMLHFSAATASHRLTFMPTYIQRVAIDPVFHTQLVEKLSELGIPVYNYKDINVIKSGGIEVRGFRTALAPRRKQAQARHERYTFVRYDNPHSLAGDPWMGQLHALTVLLQIVRENVATSKIRAVEVANEQTNALLTPLISDIFHGEPSVILDLQVSIASADNYKEVFNETKINGDFVTQDASHGAIPARDMHLVIATDILSNKSFHVFENLTAALRPGGFILLQESAKQLDWKILLKERNLTLAGRQIDPVGKSYLLFKKRKKTGKPIVIRIAEKIFSWLESVKEALKKSANEDEEAREVILVSQDDELSGLVGFMTCMRYEVGSTNVRYVLVQDKDAPKFDLSVQFYADQLNKELVANVLKRGQWGSYRHLLLNQSSASSQVEHAYINTLIRGDIKTLRWIESPLNSYQADTSPDTALCSVYYASLNFRDVMLANGKLSPDVFPGKLTTEECPLGLEFSGRDADGRRVMGINCRSGALAITVLADLSFAWEVPDEWTLEQAATVPVVYATSYYALLVRGQLKAGESILIHSGAGGVGQAAIAVALHLGCTVYTTVGTLEKREFLKRVFPQLTDRQIGCSRDTSFEQLILTETRGRGVDVVLNSLAEEKLLAGIRCLATNGRFLEIGKYDLWNDNPLGMSMFLKNISFHGILLEMLFEDYAERQRVMELVSGGIKNGTVRPLISTVFLIEQFQEAFKFMASGRHIGKILLKIRDEEPVECTVPMPRTVTAASRTYMNPKRSYVLVGGLGGFGLELADWMITRGARNVVLVSRTGIRTGYQALCVRRWRENGVRVVISTADATATAGAERLIEESNRLAPVGGIFNLAVILRDTLIENMKEEDLKTVISPKADVTRNLDAVSRKCCPLLDYFVVFSSMSCGRGNLGQSNYGLANSIMERIVERRQADGLHGLAIQWGVIGNVGLVMESTEGNDTVINGTVPQQISSCLATMDIFLQQPHPILSSMVVSEKHQTANSDDKIDLVSAVLNTLGIKDSSTMNPHDTLNSMGMDSLTNVEIKQTLERNYDIILSLQKIGALTVAELQQMSSTRNVEIIKH